MKRSMTKGFTGHLYHRRVERHAQKVRASVDRGRLADDPRRPGSKDVPFARRRQRNVHFVPQSRPPRKGKGDARAFRATHRRGVGKGPCKLRKASMEKGKSSTAALARSWQRTPEPPAFTTSASKMSTVVRSSLGKKTTHGASGQRKALVSFLFYLTDVRHDESTATFRTLKSLTRELGIHLQARVTMWTGRNHEGSPF